MKLVIVISDNDNNDDNDDNDDDDNDDSDDSEDSQISSFVDGVLKVSKEIVNDDSKNDDSKKLLKLSKENADLKKNIYIYR